MRVPSKTDVGPFAVSDITDYVRGDLVAMQNVPITLEQKGKYAILAPPGKDLRIICVGCFEPGMSLNDDRKCKKISSYCQHWDAVKRGNVTCNATDENTLEECMERCRNAHVVTVLDKAWSPTKQQQVIDVESLQTKVLRETDTAELVAELKKRCDDFKYILPLMDIETVVQYTKERGVKTLYDSRFSDLEAEMRRITDPTRPEIDTFYAATSVDDKPHYLDKPMIDLEVMLEMHHEKELRLNGTVSGLTGASDTTALVNNKRRLGDMEDEENSSKLGCGGHSNRDTSAVKRKYSTRNQKKRKVAKALKRIT